MKMLSARVPCICQQTTKRYIKQVLRLQRNSNSAKANPLVQGSEASAGVGAGGGADEVTAAPNQRVKLPQRNPLVKNFMLGIVDKELLRYPEVISRDDTSKLETEMATIMSYFQDILPSKSIERSEGISPEVIEDLKSMGLFGLNVPTNYGGKGYNMSEVSVASEHEQASADISAVVMPHRTICEVIAQFGTVYQKDKYLAKMANGSIVASEAIFESKPTDAKFFGTTAEFDGKDEEWTLNGEKSFVVNAKNADLFLVLAQVSLLNKQGQMEDGIVILLVDSNLPGVQTELNQTFGMPGAQQGTIRFKNVIVSNANMIGSVEQANLVAQSLLKYNRIKSGFMCHGMLKNMLKDAAHYTTFTKHNGIHLKDMKQISDRLARMVCSTYAIESMAYLTCGLIDEFQDQDVDLEAAILKFYSLENVWRHATSCMEYMGPKCLEGGQRTEMYIRNAAQMYALNETADSLRQFIGLSGIQYAGMNIYDTIRKDRNPFMFPMHVFRKMFQNQSIDYPKMTLRLEAEVHPSLDLAAKNLEVSILRMQKATEMLLGRYGNEILNEPLEVSRIAECMVLVYATYASIARASRSYCIGLQHSDYELLIASMVSVESSQRIHTATKDIINGPYWTNDKNNQKIAKQLLKSQKYFYQNPLKYNF